MPGKRQNAMDSHLKELEEIYSAVAMAFWEKNLDGIAKYIAEDWTGEYGGHTVKKSDLVGNVREQLETLDHIDWPRTLSIVSVEGDKLTIRSEGTYRAVKKENGEQVEMKLANEDTWQKGPQGWLNIYSQSLEA